MENRVTRPEEDCIVVYGYFELNDTGLNEQASGEDIEIGGPGEDSTGRTADNYDVYTGKPLGFLYGALLPLTTMTAALFLGS